MSVRAGLAQLCDRPVVAKEGLLRARSRSTPVTIALGVFLLAAAALVVFWLILSAAPERRPEPVDMARGAFIVVALQLALALLLVVPAAASSIAGERERNTFDLLVVGRLTAKEIVASKLAGSVAVVALLLVAAAPVLVAVFGYAGLDLRRLLLVEFLTLITVVTAGALALTVSALSSRAVPAIRTGYLVTVVLFAGPALIGRAVRFEQPINSSPGAPAAVHPLVFDSPFYALHALLVEPAEAGAQLGHLAGLAVLREGAGSWGPLVQPWQMSLVVQLALAGACLAVAARAVAGRRVTPRPSVRRVREVGAPAVPASP